MSMFTKTASLVFLVASLAASTNAMARGDNAAIDCTAGCTVTDNDIVSMVKAGPGITASFTAPKLTVTVNKGTKPPLTYVKITRKNGKRDILKFRIAADPNTPSPAGGV